MVELTVRAVSVPTDVIAGCAAFVTDRAVVQLPLIEFVTDKFSSVPTVVRLDVTTFAASVVPVNVPAAAAPPPPTPSSPLMPRTP